MKILADASLPLLTTAFPPPFVLTLYNDNSEVSKLLDEQQILLCRATLRVNAALLRGHACRYVATASSGTDHIDTNYLQAQNIGLINARGSNATAVADYVLASIAYLQKYVGLTFHKAAIVGIGAVGTEVAARLSNIVREVVLYDPPRSLRAANFVSANLAALSDCDLICLHANWHQEPPYPSHNLFNAQLFATLKKGAVIINAARGGIVNEHDLLQFANHLRYCTDVFINEPAINYEIIKFATLCTPHIAGHSVEAKLTAIAMIAEKLHDYYQLPRPRLLALSSNLTIAVGGISVKVKEPHASVYAYADDYKTQRGRFLPCSAYLPWLNSSPAVYQSWDELILSYYNPLQETKALKQATASGLATTFTALRRAHQHRHNFCRY